MILAGGQSRRMGREKLSIEVGGVPMVEHVREVLSTCCQEVLLVGGGVRSEGVEHITDERPGRQGPLAGIEAGLAASKYQRVFVAAGDMPFVSEGLVGYLLERLGQRDASAVIPRYGGRSHPLCGAYARALLPQVSEAVDRGARSVHEFLGETAGVEYVGEELLRFGDPDVILMNVNSPRDLERARREVGR